VDDKPRGMNSARSSNTRPRWGQLTYASFDRGNGANGGWQIKETSGELDDEEIKILRSRIVTQFDSESSMSAFPSAAELAALPRRLTYMSDGESTAAYWHSVMAGRDATGRPGNVFSHVLLDRCPDEISPAIRPIELWRSPDLLCPFGTDQVAAASLAHADHPAFGVTVNRQSVLEFLFEPAEWRAGLLSVLLDALHAALEGGPKVILSTDSADKAAMWIAAVSMLMTPARARGLNFSVYERANGLRGLLDRGVHLICVPSADVGLLPSAEEVAILDEHEIPNLGDVGGPRHVTQAGSKIEATYWSTLAQAALVDVATADAAMAALDDVAARVPDHGREPSWPLAMAALILPERFEDVQSEASAVVKRWSPESLRTDSMLFSIATATFKEMSGASAEAAWERLNEPHLSSIMQEMYAQTYAERVLADWDWLARPGDIPLPGGSDSVTSAPILSMAAQKALLGLPDRLAAAASIGQAFAALKLVDFVHRSALLKLTEEADEYVKDAVALVVERVIQEIIDDDNLSAVMLTTAPRVRSTFVRDNFLAAVENTKRFQSQSPGRKVPPAFFAWLFDESEFVNASIAAQNLHQHVPPMVLEYAIWRCRTGASLLEDVRPLAAVGLLQALEAGVELDAATDQVLVAHPPWHTTELLAVESEFPGILEPEFFYPALLSDYSIPAVLELCRMIVANRASNATDGEAVSLANLRLVAASDWTSGSFTDVLSKAHWILAAAEDALRRSKVQIDVPELSCAVLVAATLSLTEAADMRSTPKALGNLIRAFETRAGAEKACSDLERLVARRAVGSVGILALASQALQSVTGYPGPSPDAGIQAVADIGLRAGLDARLIDIAIRMALKVGAIPDHDEFFASISSGIWDSVRHRMSDRQAEKTYSECEKFAREWWKDLQGQGSSANQSGARSRIRGVFKPAARKD
jgi:hypothetical protein